MKTSVIEILNFHIDFSYHHNPSPKQKNHQHLSLYAIDRTQTIFSRSTAACEGVQGILKKTRKSGESVLTSLLEDEIL